MAHNRYRVLSPRGITLLDGMFYPAGAIFRALPMHTAKLEEIGLVARILEEIEEIHQGIPNHWGDPFAFVWRGEWDKHCPYRENEGVHFEGFSYVSIAASMNIHPSSGKGWQRI